MAELIAAVVEAFVAMIAAIAEALPAILEGLIYVAAGSFTIIAYAISPQFRERKRRQWKERPKRKYLDLGISSLCLGALAFMGVWIFLGAKPIPTGSSLALEEAEKGGEFRLMINAQSGTGAANQMKIAVKNGGIAKLLHTKSLHELGQAIRENVTVLGSANSLTNKLQPVGPADGSQPFRLDTNRTTSAAGSSH